MRMSLRFTMLGAVECTRDGVAVALGGSKQRTVMSMLLLANGRSVSVDQLVESVWGTDPANGAVATLRVFVSNLRRAVCPEDTNGIRFDGHGYACRFEYDLDVFEFEELCRRAAMAASGSDVAAWRRALDLFRGEPLGGLEPTEPVRREQVRLAEARLTALDAMFASELAAGRHREIVSELSAAAEAEPLREELRRALMVALYRSGRQADALRTYRLFRDRLIDELGIEPGPELRRLEQLVLEQSPSLDLDAAAPLGRPPSTIDVRNAQPLDGRLELEDGRVVVLTRRVTVVGRDEAADVTIDDRRVSRQHAVIRSRMGQYVLIDDGSTNGTDVNGEPVDHHRLAHGDLISLGGYGIRFVL